MHPEAQDSSQEQQPDKTRQPSKSAVSQAGPRTWVVRWTGGEFMSGIGVLATAIIALLGGVMAYLPAFDGQVPFAAGVILSVICFPTSSYLFYIAVRRMRWEHLNGGVIKGSLSGGGIILAFFAVFIALTLIIYR